jgi:hypothetical protein
VESSYPQVAHWRNQGSLAGRSPRSDTRLEMTRGPRFARGASSALSPALAAVAELEFRLGDWAAAHASALEALRTARAAGLPPEVMTGLVRLALIEAGLGRVQECRSHAAEVIRLARRPAEATAQALAGEALGLLELGHGRTGAAIERLEWVARICREHPCAGSCAVAWAPDLAEARVRRGDPAGARWALGHGARRARRSCASVAAWERARALLAGDHAYETLFRRALGWSEWSRQPFERARTKLCFGERLGRAGRWAEAHAYLAAALESFEALGAGPWAERASTELAVPAG